MYSRQEYWSELPFSSPWDRPDPGIKPRPPVLQADSFLPEPPRKPVSGFPDSSVSKESICNAGDPRLIPGSGRSTGEGIGYPHKYSWASLVAHLVKNLPAMQETWVQSLGWEDPPEKGKATHSSILV